MDIDLFANVKWSMHEGSSDVCLGQTEIELVAKTMKICSLGSNATSKAS